MAFKLKELNGQLGEIIAGITIPKPMVLLRERKEDYQVWVEPDYLYIQDLRVCVYGAEFYKFSRQTEEYEIDHDVYYFFNVSTGRLVYSEYGSNLEVCVTNYCTEVGKEVEDVGELLCTYILDNGKFLNKKVLTRDKL